MATRVEAAFPDAYLSVGSGQWFLIGPSTMTTQELSQKLGLLGDSPINGIVVSVGSYFGRAPLSVWEWLAAKMGADSGATGT